MQFVRSVALALVAASVPAALSGCQRTLMQSPSIITKGGVDPYALTPVEHRTSEAFVFTASGRTVAGGDDPARYYTNDRSRPVRLGQAIVEIGPEMTWDELAASSRTDRRAREPTVDLVEFTEYGTLWSSTWPEDFDFHAEWEAPGVDRGPADAFLAELNGALDRSLRKQITIFVHGFNTEFDQNLQLAAEFWHFMARDGVMVSFDWPSRGSIFSYQVDKANARFAVRQFRLLLEFLARYSTADTINIIGHSAGGPIVVQALQELSLKHFHRDDDEVQRELRLGRVILAAPDMDLDVLASATLDGMDRITEDVVVYASKHDRALGFSAGIFDTVRVGRSIGVLSEDEVAALIADDGQWVDVGVATARYPSWLGHSYFHQNPWVSSDIMMYLRIGAHHSERGLIRDPSTGFLVFPEDYEEQLPGIVDRAKALYPIPTTSTAANDG